MLTFETNFNLSRTEEEFISYFGFRLNNEARFELRRKSASKSGFNPTFPEIAQRIDLKFRGGEKLLRNVSGRVMAENLVRHRPVTGMRARSSD